MTYLRIGLLLLALPLGLSAQNTLQVVTRNVQKNIPCKSGYEVEISAEKAEIEIKSGTADLKNVQISAELVARHQRLDSAKTDLESWKFVTSTAGKTVYVRAYVGLAKGQALPSSNLKAKITIVVPLGCGAVVSNKFGKVRLENISGSVRLVGEFCSFVLQQVKGNVSLMSQYGSFEGRLITGDVEANCKRAELSFKNLQGNCRVKSEYGSIFLDSDAKTGNVDIEAKKCDVTVEASDLSQHSFQLLNNYGQISTPSGVLFYTEGSNKSTQRANLKRGRGTPFVKIVADFGKITIR